MLIPGMISIRPLDKRQRGSSSNLLHYDAVCVLSESAEIAKVRSEHRSAWFGQCDYERINRGASPCQPPQ